MTSDDDKVFAAAREALERLSWSFTNIMAEAELADIVRAQLQPGQNFWEAAKREGLEEGRLLYLLAIHDNRDAVRAWAASVNPTSEKVSSPLYVVIHCPVFTGTWVRKLAKTDDRFMTLHCRVANSLVYGRRKGSRSRA